MSECPFCKLYEAGKNVWYENEHFFIQFEPYPVTAGHVKVIPIQHVTSMFQLSKEAWHQIYDALAKGKHIIQETDLKTVYEEMIEHPLDDNSRALAKQVLEERHWTQSPHAYNFGWNEGKAAGQTVQHLHIHVIPRYEGDTQDPAGGVRKVIPEKGNYKKIT